MRIESSRCSTSSPAFDVVSIWILAILVVCHSSQLAILVVYHCWLNLQFANGTLSYIYLPPVYLLWWGVYSDLLPIFNGIVFLLLRFKCSLYILDTSSLSDIFCKYFLPVYGFSSHSLNVFHRAVLTVMKSSLVFLSRIVLLVLYLKNHCLDHTAF
uniref:Uncharacterized protein n=1 Tax=Myotis myotis TaxID=51298 RepID=A0A7J7XHZ4_MYOMY|nr:hypothetical protein mMyoMyo1_011789 [Myotis myotis]